jgi:hypothetical protein
LRSCSSSRTPPCIRNSPHNYVILRDETPNLPPRQSHMEIQNTISSKGSNISLQCRFPLSLSLSPPICRRRAAEVVTRRTRFLVLMPLLTPPQPSNLPSYWAASSASSRHCTAGSFRREISIESCLPCLLRLPKTRLTARACRRNASSSQTVLTRPTGAALKRDSSPSSSPISLRLLLHIVVAPNTQQAPVLSQNPKMTDGPLNGGNFTHNNTTAPTSDRVLPLFSLKGRTAIVSGAGAGIGLAVAHALAEAGANIAIWYNSNKKAIEEAEKIEKEYGVKCMLLPRSCN